MDPLTIAALVSGGIKLTEGLFGGFKANKAKKELEEQRANRPTYEVPNSAKDALGVAKTQAYGEMPGKDYLEDRLGQTTAAGARKAQQVAPSSAAALGAVTDIYGRQMDAERELGYQSALYRQQAMQNYQGALGQMAGYEDQAFNMNEYQPWQVRMNELQSDKQAGQQQFSSGVSGALNVAGNYFGAQAQMGAMNAMNPGGQGGSQVGGQGVSPMTSGSGWMNTQMNNPSNVWNYNQ